MDHSALEEFYTRYSRELSLLRMLALDIRWSWNHVTDTLWRQIDPTLWRATKNPWMMLKRVSMDRLTYVFSQPQFLELLEDLSKERETMYQSPAWFQQTYPESPLKRVAYFSMEFMLDEGLPIYVGGLGNVAGDQLKAASELGVPVIGVGLFYQQGYFRQEIDRFGNQQVRQPYNEPGQVPVSPLRKSDGEWLRVQVRFGGFTVWLRCWEVYAGRVKLYLLDSNDPANLPVHRTITNEIYSGGPDHRIKQEIILGIGGWRLLQALDEIPDVCHLNEGHAAFLVLERANWYKETYGVSFWEALELTRAGNVFTTHTAVPAGFDRFDAGLVGQFLGEYAVNELNIDFPSLMQMGRKHQDDEHEPFNMAFLAIRGSAGINGVSKLHGEVSRKLFSDLFPRWPLSEVPIGHVTNGVHMATWDGKFSDRLWTEACGKDRWRGDLETVSAEISKVPSIDLWEMRNESRSHLVNFARRHLANQYKLGGQDSLAAQTEKMFSKDALTLGFARRFVAYKRSNLLLMRKDRFAALLKNSDRPVQLFIAGKAGPGDQVGTGLIREWVTFIHEFGLHGKVGFLSDYDMAVAKQLVRGVDVWLNTPKRPWEASGTSGMKVLVNGGLNLSTLDGWWAEAYDPKFGWALGDQQDHEGDPNWDDWEAEQLIRLLEEQVVPEFYNRNAEGVPDKWVDKMRHSMSFLTPRFSANRAVREYTESYYLPAATRYLERAIQSGERSERFLQDRAELHANWSNISFEQIAWSEKESGRKVALVAGLGKMNSDWIEFQLYAEATDEYEQETRIFQKEAFDAAYGLTHYSLTIPGDRPQEHYSVRMIPKLQGLSYPLELALIRWWE
ncbi:MAG: alpha-glucan family phosphorylase [Lunatimonas sp.]|uniref:alpha-glucan family phosphorylase n=1 Tax=Lunatimonas sp. TaxID=2060141 RepID=UPI00263ABF6A|nr:alpha-glucan family phosphorylase [Lunatimonas sp.]MCC5937094.1 alpha-glucan family phosphorylase [Lunatimonas sp.]